MLALTVLPLGGALTKDATGQEAPGAKEIVNRLPAIEPASRWRAEMRAKVGLNMSASFTGLGAFAPQTAAGGGVGVIGAHSYDDGFNLTDALTGGDGRTATWRYYNAGQVAGTVIA